VKKVLGVLRASMDGGPPYTAVALGFGLWPFLWAACVDVPSVSAADLQTVLGFSAGGVAAGFVLMVLDGRDVE